jgi:hypothetical protein
MRKIVLGTPRIPSTIVRSRGLAWIFQWELMVRVGTDTADPVQDSEMVVYIRGSGLERAW